LVSGKVLVRISVSLRSHSSRLAGSISRLVLPPIHSTKERQQQQHKKLQTQRPHSKRTTNNNQESLFNLLLVEHHHEHHGDTNKTTRTEEQEREQRDEQATESSSSSSEDEKENRQRSRSSSRERLRMSACWSVLEADTSSGRARGSCERMERKQYREREARFFVACCTTKRASASVSVSHSEPLSVSLLLHQPRH